MEEKDFKKKLELFLNEYICEAFWHYEELETQYVILLTTEIYKQALHDFHFFVNDYLK